MRAHLENIGDETACCDVSGQTRSAASKHGLAQNTDRPPADRPQIDDSLTETRLKWYIYFPKTINGLLFYNSPFTE